MREKKYRRDTIPTTSKATGCGITKDDRLTDLADPHQIASSVQNKRPRDNGTALQSCLIFYKRSNLIVDDHACRKNHHECEPEVEKDIIENLLGD